MGKFVIRHTAAGVKLDLKATNGEVIASSEIYAAESACRKGIQSVRRNCTGAVEDQTGENHTVLKHPKFEVYIDKAGEYRFRLKAKNGQVIAVSEEYKTKAACMNGIESVQRNAPEATVEKAE